MLRKLRLIPARAGNTRWSPKIAVEPPAHPRSRGEHAFTVASTVSRVGSSPLARGTQAIAESNLLEDRLIPARAGNTHHCNPYPDGEPAHPRSRGEHYLLYLGA